MKVRLMAIDIDGTLLTSDGRITSGVLGAVRAAQSCGVRVCLATGRMWSSAARYVQMVGADSPVILHNGGMVYDFQTGRVLRRVTLAHDVARAVLEVLRDFPQVEPHLCVDDRVYIARRNALSGAYARREGVILHEVGDLIAFLPPDPMKILIVGDPHDLSDVHAVLARLPHRMNLVFSLPHYLEVLPAGSSKGAALRYVAELFGVPPEAILAAGDYLNDLEMIEFAGLGVAMANAPEALRRRADYVAPSNDAEGLRDVIERFILSPQPVG